MSRKSIEKLIVKGLILVGVLAMFPIGADAEWKKIITDGGIQKEAHGQVDGSLLIITGTILIATDI